MATKRTPTPKKTADPHAAIRPMVDELGALEKELAPWKPKLDRAEHCRRFIRAHFDRFEATEAYEVMGQRFTVLIGPRAMARTVNVLRAAKELGTGVFRSVVRITLQSLADSRIDPAIVDKIVDTAQTGTRTLKIHERAAEQVAA